MMSPPVRTLVVDDEPLARRALRRLTGDVSWLQWIGEAHNGTQAAELIERERPELVFLDVELPGMSGIDVLRRTTVPLVVIFTTAYDEYALTAFELGAIDYLRKPFGRERFIRSIERAVPQLEARRASSTSDGNSTAPSLEARMTLVRQVSPAPAEIFVRDRGSVVPLRLADITRFESDGDYVAAYVARRRYLIYANLGDLADRFTQAGFLRIHRSHMVNLASVAAVTPIDQGRVAVQLLDGGRVEASRSGSRALRRYMRERG